MFVAAVLVQRTFGLCFVLVEWVELLKLQAFAGIVVQNVAELVKQAALQELQ